MLPSSVSADIRDPLWRGGENAVNISNIMDNYRHNVLVDGGFWSASFNVGGDMGIAEDWLAEGLGKHLEVRNGSLTVIWEGFVNEVVVSLGRLEMTMGPILDVANSVDLVYSTVDTSGGGRPRVGVRANTGIVQDLDSQSRWGVRTKILSSGGVNVDIAPQIRDLFIQENAQPPKTQRFSSKGTAETKITVNCLGYYHWLDYVYDQMVVTGDRDASEKILDILSGTDAETSLPYNPNSAWLPWDTFYVEATNTTQVKAWEEKHKLAKDLIDGVVVVGDASLNRWTFGIYENRRAYYRAAPTRVEYLQYLTGNAGTVLDADRNEVYPWDMRPGRWMLFPDFMTTRRHSTDLRSDPRAMFIEGIDFTAPYTMTASAGPTARLDQMLGQLGLSGVGA